MHPFLARLFTHTVQIARGWDFRRPLRELERLQYASEDEIRDHRRGKLEKLLAHAQEHVPYYRTEMQRLGASAEDFRSEEDLQRLPVVNKSMLREDYGRFFATGGTAKHDVWTSSGSTGQPFPFRLDRATIATNLFASLARARRWWNVDIGVREAMIWSGVRNVGGSTQGALQVLKRRLSWGLKNQRLIDVCNLDADAIRQGYEMMLSFRPQLLRCMSSGLHRFCVGLEELGLDGRKIVPRCAVFTGEGCSPSQRELIERVLGCKTVCEYGCTELGVIAFECPQGGLHVSHDNFILEYHKADRPALPGEEAELVVTNLNEFAAPLIRYAVGDIVVPSDDKCDCGRTLPLIAGIRGRTHDKILKSDGTTVHGLYFTHIFDNLPKVHQFRVVQDCVDRIRIDLKSSESIPATDKQFIQEAVERVMGEGVEVVVEQVAELPVSSSGKVRWIVSDVETTT